MLQIAIIGLGNFGYYLGRELYRRGCDVIGLDSQTGMVQKAKNDLSQAVVADATDKETLMALGLGQVDLAVVTIGTNMLASILASFHLKEMGIQRVYAKALSEEHELILKRVGVDEILFPERDLAMNLAQRIQNPNLIEYLPSIQDFGIFELDDPRGFAGKALKELNLINRYGIQVIAIREGADERLTFIPKGDYIIRSGDVFILLGANADMSRLLKDIESGRMEAPRGKQGD
ncbi:MAG: TrkA family potassium uptake protein [Syntrophobacteraceae bacterium]|jgi:trk system potassium uptake protein TrkA|nr:TrkA family potassium uptake protein [Syntrophobacteraceae bacterium]